MFVDVGRDRKRSTKASGLINHALLHIVSLKVGRIRLVGRWGSGVTNLHKSGSWAVRGSVNYLQEIDDLKSELSSRNPFVPRYISGKWASEYYP